jgi:hypothetical protein
MNYNFYLFSKLFDTIISVEYEYDYMFDDLIKLFKEYNESSYNDVNYSDYDCMVKFFNDNRDYIKQNLKNERI